MTWCVCVCVCVCVVCVRVSLVIVVHFVQLVVGWWGGLRVRGLVHVRVGLCVYLCMYIHVYVCMHIRIWYIYTRVHNIHAYTIILNTCTKNICIRINTHVYCIYARAHIHWYMFTSQHKIADAPEKWQQEWERMNTLSSRSAKQVGRVSHGNSAGRRMSSGSSAEVHSGEGVLQCVAMWCSVLHWRRQKSAVLNHPRVCVGCNGLQWSAMRCSVLQCVAVFCCGSQ